MFSTISRGIPEFLETTRTYARTYSFVVLCWTDGRGVADRSFEATSLQSRDICVARELRSQIPEELLWQDVMTVVGRIFSRVRWASIFGA